MNYKPNFLKVFSSIIREIITTCYYTMTIGYLSVDSILKRLGNKEKAASIFFLNLICNAGLMFGISFLVIMKLSIITGNALSPFWPLTLILAPIIPLAFEIVVAAYRHETRDIHPAIGIPLSIKGYLINEYRQAEKKLIEKEEKKIIKKEIGSLSIVKETAGNLSLTERS